MLDWNFIFDKLKAREFSVRWISWIKLIYYDKSQILNGLSGNLNLPKKGLRHNDQLSSLLFVLATDTFTKKLELTDHNGIILG